MKNRKCTISVLAFLALAVAAIQSLAQSTYQPYTFSTLAGISPGSADGSGIAARFNSPAGLAVDSAGNVYVADTGNNTIRKVTPNGMVTTLAGLAGVWDKVDGTGSAARFGFPTGAAVDSTGNLYVADSSNNTIRKVTPAGVVTTLAGTGSATRFSFPTGAAVDSTGNLYVADSGNNTIRKVTPVGVVTTLAGLAGNAGSSDGMGSAARFDYPEGVAVDSAGNVFVADTGNHTIRKVTSAGEVTTLAGLAGGYGNDDGQGNAARFNYPTSVAVDTTDNVYVADNGNNTIRKVTPAGMVTTLAGLANADPGNVDGTGGGARFRSPSSVAVDTAGNVYVADSGNNAVHEVTPAGAVTTLAGRGSIGSVDGPTSDALFSGPCGVAVDRTANVYVADCGNNTIRKVTSTGAVTTLAGLAGNAGSTDGTGSAARFNGPTGVAVDNAGNIYVADTFNSSIRQVTPAGLVTTLAGLAGNPGSTDGTGSAARFNQPSSVALDSTGTIYVADSRNYTIRKISPGGVVTTLAGLAGVIGSVDGTGSDARFGGKVAKFGGGPSGVAVDSTGNLYVADSGNNTIRKVTPAGAVTTLAGLAQFVGPGIPAGGSADGTGSDARFGGEWGWGPTRVAVDNAGNVYVSDYGNNTIRQMTPSRVVTTLAGLVDIKNRTSRSGDGTGSDARFNGPTGVAVDSGGNVYVADSQNNTIRKGYPAPMISNSGQPINQTSSLFGDAIFQVKATGTAPLIYQWRFNGADLVGMTNSALTVTNIQRANAGNYSVIVTHLSGSVTSQVATLTITPFNSIYAFGFSWTDTGNCVWDPTQYWHNHACNGPMWPEFMSTDLGLAYVQANNYAHCGASSSDILDQVINFKVPPKPRLSLYCLWRGGIDFTLNDLTNGVVMNQLLQRAVSINSNSVNRLYLKGARAVLVQLGLFDLFGVSDVTTNGDLASLGSGYSARFKTDLMNAMNRYSQTRPDLRILFFDGSANANEVLANPALYGFTKTTIDALDDPELTDKSFTGPGADYVNWDGAHLTTKFHKLIAAWNLAVLTNSIPEKLEVRIATGSQNIQMGHLQIGRDYTLQKSTDLKNWSDVQSFTASAGTNHWSSPLGSDSAAYFRLTWEL